MSPWAIWPRHDRRMWAGDGAACDAGQSEPGAVVEEVEDLHVGAVGELPVGLHRSAGVRCSGVDMTHAIFTGDS
jgi:hypothetical protein